MITVREIGNVESLVLLHMKTDTPESWKLACEAIRAFIETWTPMAVASDFDPMLPFVYKVPTQPDQGLKNIGTSVDTRETALFLWKLCVAAAEKRATESGAASVESTTGSNAPPLSSVARSLQNRKAPPYPHFSNKTKADAYRFIAAVAPELVRLGVEVADARALLATLMAGDGSSFLVSRGCIEANTSLALLGALLMEVERVDSEGQLRTRIFCADPQKNDSLLDFIDRIGHRHHLYLLAFPKADPAHEALLNRVLQVMPQAELGVQVLMRQAKSLADVREQIRTLNIPGVNVKAKPDATPRGGAYHVSQKEDVVIDGTKADQDMATLTKMVGDLSRTVATQAAALEKLNVSPTDRPPFSCYECGKEDHLARNCPVRHAKIAAKKLAKAAAAEAEAKADFP